MGQAQVLEEVIVTAQKPAECLRDVYTANQLARNHYHQQDADSWALFGQGTFNLRDDMRLSIGLRYTEEEKEVVSTQFVSDDLTGLDIPTDNYQEPGRLAPGPFPCVPGQPIEA